MTAVAAKRAIGQSQVRSPRRTEDTSRRFGFGESFLYGSIAAHFTGREVAQADAEAERRVLGNGATEADFDVVGMRSESEQIHALELRSHRVQLNARSAFSGSP